MDGTSIDAFRRALVAIDRVAAEQMLRAALTDSKLDDVVTQLVVPALERIGDDWVEGKVSLANVYMSSRICDELLHPMASRAGARRQNQPTIGIAALLDYHLLGKKLVELALRASGYDVIDLGHGIGVEELTVRVRDARVEVLLISTLMLPSALKVKELKETLGRAGLAPKIVVGGAPFRFDDRLWKEVGADYMGVSASDALKILDSIVEERDRADRPQHDVA